MKAGFHKLDITPDHPVRMAGFSRSKKSIGVLDPIQINTVIFEKDGLYSVVSLLDSIIIEDCVIQPVMERIHQTLKIPKESICIGCIHTHSAPCYFKPYFEDTKEEAELKARLVDQFCESITNAHSSLSECSFILEGIEVEGEYGNRNNKEGKSDKHLFVLTCTKKGESSPWFSFGSIACHPTILDGRNLYLSADLIGHLRLKFQERYGHPFLFSNGCCGDVSTRFFRKSSGIKELHRMTQSILDQFDSRKKQFPLNLKAPLTSSLQLVHQEDFCKQSFTQNEKVRLELSIAKELSEKQKVDPRQTDHSRQALQIQMDKTLLNALTIKSERSPFPMPLRASCVRMGNLLIISLCGDVSSSFAHQIRSAFPNENVIILGYCYNYSNYFVPESEYGKYFETYISRLDQGEADEYIDETIKQAKTLFA